MFPLLFPAPLNWIRVKQQIRGLWLCGWAKRQLTRLKPRTQASQHATKTTINKVKYNSCAFEKRKAGFRLREPLSPNTCFLSFCVISISSMAFLFLFLLPKLDLPPLAGSRGGHACSSQAKTPSSAVSWVLISRAFQRALGRKGILEKHPEEERRARGQCHGLPFKLLV